MSLRTLFPLTLALLSGITLEAQAQTWVMQYVDVGSHAGTATSVGLVSGFPVISYATVPGNLRYATLDPSTKTWKLYNVDASGPFTSLDADSSGVVHISYADGGATSRLRYYRNDHGQAAIQPIDEGSWSSIRADGSGAPHVSYYSQQHLQYASRNGTTWVSEQVDSTANRGRYNSLALDAGGSAQIAYYDGSARRLLVARGGSGSWSTQVVDSTASDPGRFNSIALLPANGRARISYIAATTLKVRFASYNGAVWSLEDVGDVGQVGDFSATSLKLDSGGNPHIAYYDANSGGLIYASRLAPGVWSLQTVDTQGNVGEYCSLTLDDQDRPIISYYDATNQALKIAYGNYPDADNDGIPDPFDPDKNNPDVNHNGIPDGLEGGALQGGTRLPDEPIFGCGSIGPMGGGGTGGSPPIDMLFLLVPTGYLATKIRPRRSVPAR